MALTIPGMSAAITVGLVSGGLFGSAVPKLALGIANGIVTWAAQIVVTTSDSGQVGIGQGLAPLVVPLPAMTAALLLNFPSQGMLGPMAPLEAVGLANGICTGFLTANLKTTHSTVGSGTCVTKLIGPSAIPIMIAGFASAGMTGNSAVKKATAIAMALETVFNSLAIPIIIAGSGSPATGTGVGLGKIL